MIVLFYFLVFLGLILEGEAVLFIAVFYTIKGFFNPIFIIPVIFSGVFVGDILWYKLGFYIDCYVSFLGRWICRLSAPFDGYIQTRLRRAIFISKFTYGLGHAAIARAGALKVPMKEFLKADAIASFFWMLIVGGIAHASAAAFDYFRRYLKIAEIGLLFGLVVLFFLTWLISRISKKRLSELKNVESSSLKRG